MRPGAESSSGPRRSVAVAFALVAGLGSACRDEGGEDPTRDDEPAPMGTTGDSGSSTGEPYVPSEEATDQCALAPSIGAGRHHGSMRGKVSELGGACGREGPDAFFRLDVPRRSDVWLQGLGVGFSPRVGVLPHACSNDWASRMVGCTEGVGTWLVDVPAGASLVISVGADDALPLFDEPPPADGPDPLGFELEVRLRNVLDEGDPCEPPGRGRCGSGTACVVPPAPEDDPDAPPPEAVCTVLPGDTCQTAIPVAVPLTPGGTSVEIDPATPQTDAHLHSCGGARSRERVLRLTLPEIGPHSIVVHASHPEVGLALRAPGCLAAQERGCVDPVGEAGGPLQAEIEGMEAFLFVELPPALGDEPDGGTSTGEIDMGEEAPIVVDIERFEPSPFGQ
ncbi:MAG: hypothetical protein KDK70_23595 [Myxococcales bacterium]|nr:hypothetical protein [Myxococcales bacterium]